MEADDDNAQWTSAHSSSYQRYEHEIRVTLLLNCIDDVAESVSLVPA